MLTTFNIERIEWIRAQCGPADKIIDIGGNDGHTFMGTGLFRNVTTIDLDIYNILGFFQMDAHNIMFPNKFFNISVLGEILEHVENPIQVIREAVRVSERVIITVPDEVNWSPEARPYDNLEKMMQRENKNIEELSRQMNPAAVKFHTDDNYQHLYHHRNYTEETLRKDIFIAIDTDNYRMVRLQPRGWSFFAVTIP